MNFPNLIPILHTDLLKYLMAVTLNNKYGYKLDVIEIILRDLYERFKFNFSKSFYYIHEYI